ncbi:MAG: class II fructose-bisphosphate aldolase [Candidatus Moranbacteria bacterium]|nr:class II fructose-bisphosphate aldolase [Candidatus Moranbacteria bacterium]
MLASVKDILWEAKNNGYAVGAFNASNMEVAQAIIRAAAKKKCPAIIQVTEKTLSYAGDSVIVEVIKAVIEKESGSLPIGFHLDHGRSLEVVARAIELGITSVMIDASRSDLQDNIAITKRVVDFAHPKKVAVQAEIGNVPRLGEIDQNPNWDKIMTDPLEAKWLVEETGVDALAIGIGNAHDFFRERPEPDWERLDSIHKLLPDIPLILHGASDWVNHKVVEAVKRGVVCFNVDTDLRIAFNTTLCQFTHDKCDILDPRKILAEARDAVQKVVEKKIDLFRNLK